MNNNLWDSLPKLAIMVTFFHGKNPDLESISSVIMLPFKYYGKLPVDLPVYPPVFAGEDVCLETDLNFRSGTTKKLITS